MTEEETIIKEQIMQIKSMGQKNLMNIKRVKRMAQMAGLTELEIYITNHQRDYVYLVLNGKFREEKTT